MLLLVCAFSRAQYEAIILGDGYANGIANGQIIASTGQFAGGVAVMWDVNTLQRTVLHPDGFEYSKGFGVGGGYQVGSAKRYGSNVYQHAIYWNDTAKEYIDFGPGIFGYGQEAHGTDGIQQVGTRSRDPLFLNSSAVVWSGTAQSAIDLTPGMRGVNVAYGVHAGRQVGVADNRATMWSGTPGSAVSLHPFWASTSYAYGIFGNQQVGVAFGPNGGPILWTGTAESAINLAPNIGGRAYATNGAQQAGFIFSGDPNDPHHAAAWSGSPETMVDLAQFVPDLHYTEARGIDEFGNIVGFGYDNFGPKAILWKPIPEPSTSVAIVIGLASVVFVRRRAKA